MPPGRVPSETDDYAAYAWPPALSGGCWSWCEGECHSVCLFIVTLQREVPLETSRKC
jgi:hypothetical protein